MNFLDEYRRPDEMHQMARAIHRLATRPWTLMEVCGGQTHTIVKSGLQDLLPELVTLVHGPGCPVCVTTGRHGTPQDVETIVGTLNRKLMGWSNYFCLGPVSNAYRAVDRHTVRRRRRWLCAKHKVQGRGTQQFSEVSCTRSLAWSGSSCGPPVVHVRHRDASSESRVREIRTHGSTSGVWKRGRVRPLRHRQTKGSETDRPHLTHRATPRLYLTGSDSHGGSHWFESSSAHHRFQGLMASFFSRSR